MSPTAMPDTQVRVLGPEDHACPREMLSMFGLAFGEVATYPAHQPDDGSLRQLPYRRSGVATQRKRP